MEFIFYRVNNMPVGEGENKGYKHFLLFSTMFTNVFLHRLRTIKTWICLLQGGFVTLSAHQLSSSSVCIKSANLTGQAAVKCPLSKDNFVIKFLRICRISLLKTPWEKEKLLVTSNFSFSHSVFQPFGELSTISIKFEIFVFNLFDLEESKICHLGKG